MTQEFELKVAELRHDGTYGPQRTVKWRGRDGIDAAERYVDCHDGYAVWAWRPIRHGLFVGAPEPGSD